MENAGCGYRGVMELDRRMNSLVAFYFSKGVAHEFSRGVAHKPHGDEAIRVVSKRAYRDLARTLRGIGSHPSAERIKRNVEDSVLSFVESLKEIGDQDRFDIAHQAWCEGVVEMVNAEEHPQRPTFKFHYGQAQKWLNMTLKYLAVLDHSAIGKVYQYLHAPVDRIIYDRGKETLEVTPPNGAWSTLGGADYRQYQTQLREAIKDKAWDCVMDWEADA